MNAIWSDFAKTNSNACRNMTSKTTLRVQKMAAANTSNLKESGMNAEMPLHEGHKDPKLSAINGVQEETLRTALIITPWNSI